MGQTNSLGTVRATKHSVSYFYSVPEDSARAMAAGRRECLNCALEAVKRMSLPPHLYFKTLVVVIPANFARCHLDSSKPLLRVPSCPCGFHVFLQDPETKIHWNFGARCPTEVAQDQRIKIKDRPYPVRARDPASAEVADQTGPAGCGPFRWPCGLRLDALTYSFPIFSVTASACVNRASAFFLRSCKSWHRG